MKYVSTTMSNLEVAITRYVTNGMIVVTAYLARHNTAIDSMYIPNSGFWLQTQCWLPNEDGFVYYVSFYHYGNEEPGEDVLTEEEREHLNELISDIISQLYDAYYNDSADDSDDMDYSDDTDYDGSDDSEE